MGTQGDINYNLELVPRQAGYPMILPPFEEATTPLVIYDMGAQSGEYFKKIKHAWKSIDMTRDPEAIGLHLATKHGSEARSDKLGCLPTIFEAILAFEIQEALKAEELEGTLVLKRKLEVALAAQVSTQEEADWEQQLKKRQTKEPE
ncbi:hypothetical protein CR513_08206, partial [Mucuna pruriens]